MSITTASKGRRKLAFFVLVGLTSVCSAQSQAGPTDVNVSSSGQLVDSRVIGGGIPSPPPSQIAPQAGASGAGLIIIPTFNADIDDASRTIINNAIAFYQNTFTNNVTVNIEFHNMDSGLGSTYAAVYPQSYSSYRTALANHASGADDATALANTPSGSGNPINGNTNIEMKSANGRAIGLNTPEILLNFEGSPCPAFTGSGCIGLNLVIASALGILTAVVEHEIDEVLGLGSALRDTTTPAVPQTEDLFRWASAGVRSYAANTFTENPCAFAAAFFSINGGVTNLNEFNNCNNGGDYGDWITHTPSQVQDAIINQSGFPFLTVTSSEVRALDVIGYNVLKKKARGQITSN